MKGKHGTVEKKNKSVKITLFIIIILIIGCVVLVRQGRNEENTNSNITTNETTNKIETTSESEEVINNTVQNETIQNTTESDENENENAQNNSNNESAVTNSNSTNTNSSEVMENSVEDDEQKSINIAKNDWGNEDGVYFNCIGMDSQGRYIIAVADSTTTQIIQWYHVNAVTGEFEIE